MLIHSFWALMGVELKINGRDCIIARKMYQIMTLYKMVQLVKD